MSPLLGSIGGISEYNYRGTLDDWPTPFSFGNLTNVEPGSVVGVSTVITGINYKAGVTASTGSLISVRNIIGISSIYSGDSATPSTTVTVSIASSTTELTAGTNIRILNTDDPDYNGEFLISSVIDAPYVTKFTYVLPQVPGGARPGVGTAQFNYEVYPFTENQQLYVRNNQILEVRIPTTSGFSTDFDKQYRTTVRVGKRYSDWNIRTRLKDNSPNAFLFNNVEGMNIGIGTTSNSITIQGLEPGLPSYAFISSGIGSFSLNGSVGITTANVSNGDSIYMYETSSNYYSTRKTSTITVGDYTASFSVRTRPVDKVPNQFSFTNLVNVPINQEQISNSITLSGADNNIPLDAQVSYPGELQINSGAFVSGTSEIFNGDSVVLKIPASVIKEYSTKYSTQLTVTGISSVFSVTTRPRPIKTFPDQFQFTDLSGITPNLLTESSIVTLSGMTVGVGDTGLASIFGVGSEFRVFRNGSVVRDYSSSSFPVVNSDRIQLRVVSPGEGSSSQTRFVVSGTDTRDVISGVEGFTVDTWDLSSRFLNCRINESSFSFALSAVTGSRIRELKFTSFVVSGLDNGCDTIITTSNPDSYIRNQNGVQVSSSQALDIKNGDTITIYMTASASYDTIKTTTVEVKRKNGADLVSGVWSVRTQVEDKFPNTFNLPLRNQSDIVPCTYRSTFVTERLSGLSEETVVPATVTSTNSTAEISKNGGTFSTSIPDGVTNGDRIDIRMKSNCDYGGPCETATVSVGERTETWTLCPQPIPFPTVTLQANAASIQYNGSVTLTWTSTFATNVTNSSGTGFTGIGSTTGSITINNLKSNTTFSITVSNSRGSATSSVNLSVAPEPAPRITLTANPTSVNVNGSTTLTWDSTDAVSVVSTSAVGFADTSTSVFSYTWSVAGNDAFLNVSGVGGKGYAVVQLKLNTNDDPTAYGKSYNKILIHDGPSSSDPVIGTWDFIQGDQFLQFNAYPKAYRIEIQKSIELPNSEIVNNTIRLRDNDGLDTNASITVNKFDQTKQPGGPVVGTEFSNITSLDGSIVVSPTINTTYSITVRNESGVTARASVDVKVNSPLCPSGAGVYFDLTQFPAIIMPVTLTVVANESAIFHEVNIPGIGIIKESDPPRTFQVLGGTVYGPCTAPKGTVYVGNEPVSGIRDSGTRPISQLVVEEMGDDWDDMVISASSGFFRRCIGTTTPLPPPAPTVTLTSPNLTSTNTISLKPFGSVTLNWTSTNATAVNSYSGYGFVPKNISGSLTISGINQNTSYNISVSGPSGIATSNTINLVLSKPTVTLTANPSTVYHNGSTTLSWSSVDATAVQSSNFGASSVNGSLTVSNLTSTTPFATTKTYAITVSGLGGTSTASVDVSILPQAPTVIISANPKSIPYNGSTSVTWNTTNTLSINSNFNAASKSGISTFSNLLENKTFTLTAYGYDGTVATASTTVFVAPKPPTVNLCAGSAVANCKVQGEKDLAFFIGPEGLQIDPSGFTLGLSAVDRARNCGFTDCEIVGLAIKQGKSFGIDAQSSLNCSSSSASSCRPGGITCPSYSGNYGSSTYVGVECGPSRIIGYKEPISLSWTSTDATSVSAYAGPGFAPTTTSGTIIIENLTKETTYSITVSNSGGTATDTITLIPSPCVPNSGNTTFENFKLGTIQYNNNTSSIPPFVLFTSNTSYSSLTSSPRSNYSYSLLNNFISDVYRNYLYRSPIVGTNGELDRYIKLFVTEKNNYRVLHELRRKIKIDTLTEVNQNASKGGIKVIKDTCDNNWETPVCISVIDEVSPLESQIRSDWLSFRSKYQNSVFWLLDPGGGSAAELKVPSEYLSDPKANGPIAVSRDNGNVSLRSDWFTTCNLAAYPIGTAISLAIDNSGSMTLNSVLESLKLFRQKCSEAGLKLIEVEFNDERWPVPHNKNLPYILTPCVPPTIQDTATNANYMRGFGVFANGVDDIAQEYFVSTINPSLKLPGRPEFTYGTVYAYIYSKYSDPVNVNGLGRPPEKGGLVYYTNAFQEKLPNGLYKYATLADLGATIVAGRTNELNIRDSNGGFVSVITPCGEVWPLQGNGVYLDLTSFSSSQIVTVTLSIVASSSDIDHNVNIIGLGRILETDSPKTYELRGGRTYGPCSSPTGNVYIGNEYVSTVKGSGTRPNTQLVMEENKDDWDDMVVETSAGIWKRFTAPTSL